MRVGANDPSLETPSTSRESSTSIDTLETAGGEGGSIRRVIPMGRHLPGLRGSLGALQSRCAAGPKRPLMVSGHHPTVSQVLSRHVNAAMCPRGIRDICTDRSSSSSLSRSCTMMLHLSCGSEIADDNLSDDPGPWARAHVQLTHE